MITEPETTLRQRNRLNAMLHIQDCAYELLKTRDFSDISVTTIAEHAGVGPATIYRYFGTKEHIVTWSEHDDRMAHHLQQRIDTLPPFQALQAAFIEDLPPLVDNPRNKAMMRAMFADDTVGHIASIGDVGIIEAIAQAIADAHPELPRLDADIVARTSYMTFDAGLAHWQADPHNEPLQNHVQRAFEALTRIDRQPIA
jgi:AcrR family transcriptional regulator